MVSQAYILFGQPCPSHLPHADREFFFTVAMPLNCSGMYRGVIKEDGAPKTAIFDDDELD